MSKDRARRRAERLAAAASGQASRERRRRWRAALSRADPRRLGRLRIGRRRRTGKLFARRTRQQRAAIATGVLIALVLVWLYVDSVSARIALTILIAVTTPAVVVLTLDRRI